ncbi:hypothetical protein BGW80DRAFT_1315768 [Lactifluus volemus]|nr:hypothetical protein BGW80DRAFT_1315768 [Lactifluus volemus]
MLRAFKFPPTQYPPLVALTVQHRAVQSLVPWSQYHVQGSFLRPIACFSGTLS